MADPAPKARWYRLTPERLIVALLLVECLLWLSQRFQWFGFNHHKGWSVLIAVAVVGAAFLLMLLWLMAACSSADGSSSASGAVGPHRRRRRTVQLALPGDEEAREQKAAVAAIKKTYATLSYDYEFDASRHYLPNPRPPGSAWLRSCWKSIFLWRFRWWVLGP